MAHAAPSSDSPSRGRHAADQGDQSTQPSTTQHSTTAGGRSSEQGPTGPSGVPQRVHLEERTNAENAMGWMTAVVGAVGIGVVVAIVVVLIIGVVQRG